MLAICNLTNVKTISNSYFSFFMFYRKLNSVTLSLLGLIGQFPLVCYKVQFQLGPIHHFSHSTCLLMSSRKNHHIPNVMHIFVLNDDKQALHPSHELEKRLSAFYLHHQPPDKALHDQVQLILYANDRPNDSHNATSFYKRTRSEERRVGKDVRC